MKNSINDETMTKVHNCVFKNCISNNKNFNNFVISKKLEMMNETISNPKSLKEMKNKTKFSKTSPIDINFNFSKIKDSNIIEEIKILENKDSFSNNVEICSLHSYLIEICIYLTENFDTINEMSNNLSHLCKTKENTLNDSLLCNINFILRFQQNL